MRIKREGLILSILLVLSLMPQEALAVETMNPVINAVDISSKIQGNTLIFESNIDFTQSNRFRQIKSWRIVLITNIPTAEIGCNAKIGDAASRYLIKTINGISYNAVELYFFADTEIETKSGNKLNRKLKDSSEYPLEKIIDSRNQSITWCGMKMYPVSIELQDGYNSWTSIAIARSGATGGIDAVCSFQEGCALNGWRAQPIINSRYEDSSSGFITDYANCKERVLIPAGYWDSPGETVKDCVNNLNRLKPIEITIGDILKNSKDANKASSNRKLQMLTESKSIIEEYRAMVKQLFQWSEEQGYVSLDGENLDVEKYANWVQDMFLTPLERTYNSENVEGFYSDRDLIISNLEIRRGIFTKLKFVYEQIAASRNVAKENQSSVSKKSTITCVKGKITKKVTAVNPKCPTGYKKK